MKTTTHPLAVLNRRKQALGMTNAQLSVRTGVSTATIKRILSGNGAASFDHVSRIAQVLGMTVNPRARRRARRMRKERALQKAEELARLTYANSALEGQGVGREIFEQVKLLLAKQLLKQKRKLWAD